MLAVPEVRQAAEFSQKHSVCSITGLPESSKSVFFAAIKELWGKKNSLAILVPSREELRAYRRGFSYFYPELPMQELYPEQIPRIQVETQSLELQAGRAAALRFLQGEEEGIVFITAEAFQQRQLAPKKGADSLHIEVGQELEQQALLKQLLAMGYERTDQVDAIGQFTLRGDILDIFPINTNTAIRVEWFDNTIDAMRSFDVENQRSIKALEELKLAPIKVENNAVYDATVLDYCAEETVVLMDEPARFFELLRNLEKENRSYIEELFNTLELEEACGVKGIAFVSGLPHKLLEGRHVENIAVPIRSVAPYNKNTGLLMEDLGNWLGDGITPIIQLSSSVKARNFVETLLGNRVAAQYSTEELIEGAVNVTYGDLDHGFRFWNEQWIFLTENDIYGMQKRKRQHSRHQGQQLQYFSDIRGGDYVVHKTHGIGRYIGVENVEMDGIHRDYLLIQYANEDKLYVPVDQVSMLHKYVGSEGTAPRLSKMGGQDWKRTTTKAAKAVTELAEELLRLYAQRQLTEGFAFSPDDDVQREFEEAFPFEETPDQLRAISEIKADMMKPQPMERLLCGDVGFGKTEVAIRAAFKCVLDGKQVALMVPTTVLAQQHYLTFRERMAHYGVNVQLLNRFQSAKEQRIILENLELGDINIIIGTHRLLQQDVHFDDLGLLIVDEEQRFGVAQKEKLKRWRTGIDVLSLSATPIPRTLHMALVSSRDMSVIESPPEDRLPVETYVCEYNEAMLKEALERELRRGGRVYYVHNRVAGLETIAARLRRLVPGINIKIAHGQMGEDQLEDAMISFYEGTCDLLLCTTIVENGLDVPLANTIIIDGAENFGLSQLYQMRGRVGRSSRLAYAYFVYRPNKALSEVAEKRLAAIRDFTELGAGFKIAMRDLEIRGAGNLLGPQQHGHIAGIGFAAYCELLEQTITRLKEGRELTAKEPEPILELPVDAYIPDDYISNPRYKMELYRRLAELVYSERAELLDEIIDRFGNPPEEVELLWRVACLRSLCRITRIRALSVRQNTIRFTFGEHAPVSPDMVLYLMQQYKGQVSYKNGKEPQLIFNLKKKLDKPLIWLEKLIPSLYLKEH